MATDNVPVNFYRAEVLCRSSTPVRATTTLTPVNLEGRTPKLLTAT